MSAWPGIKAHVVSNKKSIIVFGGVEKLNLHCDHKLELNGEGTVLSLEGRMSQHRWRFSCSGLNILHIFLWLPHTNFFKKNRSNFLALAWWEVRNRRLRSLFYVVLVVGFLLEDSFKFFFLALARWGVRNRRLRLLFRRLRSLFM